MPEISTSIQINAAPTEVSRKFYEFSKFPTFTNVLTVTRLDPKEPIGDLKVGDALRIQLNSGFDKPNSKPMVFLPLITNVSPLKFSWLGVLFSKYIFGGEHIFELESIDNGESTLLVHKEQFGGLLSHILLYFLRTDTERAFKKFNSDFKAYVESN